MEPLPDASQRAPGRTVSLDIGTKTIGVAVSDELGIAANGVATIKRETESRDLARLKKLADEYSASRVVVGLPYNQDGSLGNRGRKIRDFSKRIEESLGLDVVYWDESFSTRTVELTLVKAGMGRRKRKKIIDKMAAAVILEEYLLGGK